MAARDRKTLMFALAIVVLLALAAAVVGREVLGGRMGRHATTVAASLPHAAPALAPGRAPANPAPLPSPLRRPAG